MKLPRHLDVLSFTSTSDSRPNKYLFRALIVLLIALAAPFKASFAADYTETFSSGVAQGWTVAVGNVGNWAVDAGTYHDTASEPVEPVNITVYGGGSWATDFIYHAKINNGFGNTGNLAGVAYNYQDASNYYAVVFAPVGQFPAPPQAYLQWVRPGATTIVAQASYSGGAPNVWFDVDVIRSGTVTSVRVNGRSVFSNITQNELGTGKIGLITNFSDARFDNISLTGGLRDPMKQPFASTSIWNMPIGSDAVYAPANIPPMPLVTDTTGNDPNYWLPMPQVDWDIIVLTPNAPITNINFSAAAWSGDSRCLLTPDPRNPLFQLPIPSDFTVPSGDPLPNGKFSTPNSSAAFLKQDGHTLIHTQPFARCAPPNGNPDGSGTTNTDPSQFPPVDIYGDGIRGAHGGSGLSVIGGSIRVGELGQGSQGPKHALKLGIDSARDLFNCQPPRPFRDCFRWPAVTADFGADQPGGYGTTADAGNVNNPAMKMGALLAIPPSVNISTLVTTPPALQLAWTLQNYGAYIDDTSGIPGFIFDAERGPDGSLDVQFQTDWGFPLEDRWRSETDRTPWAKDMQALMTALRVVNNNFETSVGGGGTPRQPLAPPLAVTRFEDNAATTTGSWSTFDWHAGSFSNGTLIASKVAQSTATFSFTGTAVSWVGTKCNTCGIASVSVDGGAPVDVDTGSPGSDGSLTSEAVFYASGLASGVSHTIAISVTGRTNSADAYVAVDAVDVMP